MNNFKCRKCDIIKPVSEFIKDSTRKRGHHPYCKVCQNKIKNNKRALSRALKWQKENKDRRKIICKKWYDNNPEIVRIHKANRRKREINLSDGTLTKENLIKLSNEKCGICNKVLNWNISNSIHLDHIIPLSKGGAHSIHNVQWTCSTCNLTKGSKI